MWIVSALFSLALAQEPQSAFERSLEHDTSVTSEESWVEIKNVQFRKIEFKAGVYYLLFKKPQATVADLYCEPPFGNEHERLVIEQPVTRKRTRAFVKIFNDGCSGKKHKLEIKMDPAVGLQYPERKSPEEGGGK